jgi:hypothetical protein
MEKSCSLVGVVLLVVVLLASACGEATHTVTVDRPVTVEKASPPAQIHRHKSHSTASTEQAEFVSCDSNIEAKAATTTCPFAENVFWTYWSSDEAGSLQVWSPAVQATFATTCDSDGVRVTCTTSDDGVVKFSQAAVDHYSQSQADTYASGHDLGPDPDSGLASSGTSGSAQPYEPGTGSVPGENIPNYDNGRGYRVQCADGMYSHSGGIQGACSHHGGVAP